MSKRISIHAAKRNLLRRLNTMTVYEVERICLQFREYAVARRFIGGASIAFLSTDGVCGGAAWDERRIQEAVRHQTRVKR